MTTDLQEPLKFVVAPHIVEDLGLNLYTSLPRVLAEFVANAYDADSPFADIKLDFEAIRAARAEISNRFKNEQDEGGVPSALGSRLLPSNLTIVVEDAGHGMSRDDLKNKFLIAGRRRRKVDSSDGQERLTTTGNRPLMGRKGLGKLAGFGVAKRVEIVARAKGETFATKIVLDYEELVKARSVLEVVVPEERLDDGGDLPIEGGTRVVLSQLLHDPVKSREETIRKELGEHFEFVSPDDFVVLLNGTRVVPTDRQHAYAWPMPELPTSGLVDQTLETSEGSVEFSYRIRFTSDRHALPAEKRGVRIYAGPRLAANPSLLDADTNMHGFRMTDYMDGVVKAAFIDQQEVDYVATDRQSLRWDAPLLTPLKQFLSDQIKEACKRYQAVRDARVTRAVRDDDFTTTEIGKHTSFSPRDQRLARKIAAAIAKSSKQGVADPTYRSTLPTVLQGLGHGQLLASITELSREDYPDLDRLTREVARLTQDEFEQFAARVRTRLKAIEALRKIVEAVDFRNAQNEKEIQKLFEKAPWLVDPTYTQFLTADQRASTLFRRLADHLKIGAHQNADSSDPRRPDLVFLIGNEALQRLVVVELKSANLPLEMSYLSQLLLYVNDAEEWLVQQGRPMTVHGHLIGTLPSSQTQAIGSRQLLAQLKREGPTSQLRVRDYINVVEETQQAHSELLELEQKLNEDEEADETADASLS